MDALTDRQKDILRFIAHATEERGFPPTIREIGEEFSIRSTNGVNDHIKALERKGYLSRCDLQSRTLVATKAARLVLGLGATSRNRTVPIPVVGHVAAGRPLLAVEAVEDTVEIDSVLLPGQGREVFALRVKGDSMTGDGIHEGDFLFVRKQLHAKRGDIVVAMIESEATVKRFYPEAERIRFQPSNIAHAPIYVAKADFRETMILGVVVGVYRRI
jgi:repressor LexA